MSKFKVKITRVETYTHEVEIEAETAEAAKEIAEGNYNDGEYEHEFDCFDDVATDFSVEDPVSWYDWQSLTEADKQAVWRDSARRGWGYSLADLMKEIGNFKKAMQKGDRHATSMICARLEDCNYHKVCGKLADGDLIGAEYAAKAIYAA